MSDTNDWMKMAIEIAMDAMYDIQEEFREQVAAEVVAEHHSEKKVGWAKDVAEHIQCETPYYDAGTGTIVGVVKVPADSRSATYVRAMVLSTGNQANGPLFTKPGQPTWDSNIEEYAVHVPANWHSRPLPNGFNYVAGEGEHFMKNATRLYQNRFQDRAYETQVKIQNELGKML